MGDNVIELEEISLCPNCKARVFEVVETRTSYGQYCRCVGCGWKGTEWALSPDQLFSDLVGALRHLSNELAGWREGDLAEVGGWTNAHCITQRVKEARAVLAKVEASDA